MPYVANRPLKITRDGESVDIARGQPVPEVTAMPTFNALVNTGAVVWMPDNMPAHQGTNPKVLAQAAKTLQDNKTRAPLSRI